MKNRWLLVLNFSGLCHIPFFNSDLLDGRGLVGLFVGMFILAGMTLFLIRDEVFLAFYRAVESGNQMLSLNK